MASLVGGLLGQLKPVARRGLFGGPKETPRQATLRGASKRAYVFEIHRREVIPDLGDIGAVYVYARRTGVDASMGTEDPAGIRLEPGFIGHAPDLARRDAEHDRLGHCIGFAFDVTLVMRIEQEPIRADIARDLIECHAPVLNELLRGYQGSNSS